MGKLFGTDGIRGIANIELTTELAMQVGKATAKIVKKYSVKKPLIIIGMDTRISSEILCNALVAGICAMGVDVKILGVIPTPAVAFLISIYNADAGIMISASHNPAEFNGIKIFNSEGYKLSDEIENEIEDIINNSEKHEIYCNSKNIGSVTYDKNAKKYYIEHLKNTVSNSLKNMKIAVDTANGAASYTAEELFNGLGAKTYMLFDKPNGININENCGSTHMENLKKFVIDNNMDIGIAFDGDADRCLLIDELGNEIDGDQIMAVCAFNMKQKGKLIKNAVVGTIMTNMGFIKFCNDNDINFVTTKVGDKFVLEKMLLEGYNFGGEQSGHVIFKDYATTGDGQLTAIQVLNLLKMSGKKLSELIKVMKQYPQITQNIEVTNQTKLDFYTNVSIQRVIEELKKELGETGRIVVRPSGTEPKIRIMVEGEDEQRIKVVLNALTDTIKNELCTFGDVP